MIAPTFSQIVSPERRRPTTPKIQQAAEAWTPAAARSHWPAARPGWQRGDVRGAALAHRLDQRLEPPQHWPVLLAGQCCRQLAHVRFELQLLRQTAGQAWPH